MELVWIVGGVVAGVVGWLLGRGRATSAGGAEPLDVAAVRGDLARLYEVVARSQEQTARLASSTGALREVLASPKARGQWGERTADDVLRVAGLVEGASYVRQRATRHGTVPDVTFLLPGDRVLHMDVKFPVTNFLRHLDGGGPEQLDAFRKDVRARLRELGGRGYVDPSGGTLDYVLLFVPNESIYAFLHEQDPHLLDEALARKVVLCSPLTLFAVLAVVRQAADAAALERTSGEVLAVLGTFLQEWDRFTDSLDKLGRAVDSVERAYGEVAGTRRRALERPLGRIDELRRSGGDQPERLRAVSSLP